ncbi:MAG: hypothetical protein WC229_00745 [Candidatus Paceibacterota bacterium]|jgi:hypothetical protein
MANETCPCGCGTAIINVVAVKEEGVLFAGTDCVRRWREVVLAPVDLEKMRKTIIGGL